MSRLRIKLFKSCLSIPFLSFSFSYNHLCIIPGRLFSISWRTHPPLPARPSQTPPRNSTSTTSSSFSCVFLSYLQARCELHIATTLMRREMRHSACIRGASFDAEMFYIYKVVCRETYMGVERLGLLRRMKSHKKRIPYFVFLFLLNIWPTAFFVRWGAWIVYETNVELATVIWMYVLRVWWMALFKIMVGDKEWGVLWGLTVFCRRMFIWLKINKIHLWFISRVFEYPWRCFEFKWDGTISTCVCVRCDRRNDIGRECICGNILCCFDCINVI